MKTWMAVGIVLAAMQASGTVYADDSGDGVKFLKSCKGLLNYWDGKPTEASYDAGAMGYCVGVVRGVRGTLQILGSELKDGRLRVCLPEDYTEQAGVRSVVNYLDDHPEKLTSLVESVTMLALRSSYPCR
ncbi:Rap1a/Tai family immunity protein [Pseudomonas fluorescens]|uniref:Rap1a immunity protein domain-containing protein n=2 Tax=Pseudomonas TaxID=286 RepID=A0A5E6PSS5_PSEFL|nr:hypothetical protein PS624_00502 [Pseudomonas fluorescens]